MNIINIAREVGASAYTNRHYPDQPYFTFSPEKLEAFAAAIKYAHIEELKQKQVSLTDDKVREIYGRDLMDYRDGDYMRFARAIEAAHNIGAKA